MVSKRVKLSLMAVAATAGVVALNSNMLETKASADTLESIQSQQKTGYLNDGTGWYWFQGGQKYTGFRNYMGAYYYFVNGVRQENSWETEWGLTYYVGNDGRSVQGHYSIGGVAYNFGDNGTFYMRGRSNGYVFDQAAGQWLWMENGSRFTGFRFYMGAYYWFQNGVRQDNQWEYAWGNTYWVGDDGRAAQGLVNIGGKQYYFGNDGTFNMRKNTQFSLNGATYSADGNGVVTRTGSASVQDQMNNFAQSWYGWDHNQQYYLNLLISYESGWNQYAQNGQYFGFFQTTGVTDTSVEGQARVGLAYIANRYGNPQNAWGHIRSHGWY